MQAEMSMSTVRVISFVQGRASTTSDDDDDDVVSVGFRSSNQNRMVVNFVRNYLQLQY